MASRSARRRCASRARISASICARVRGHRPGRPDPARRPDGFIAERRRAAPARPAATRRASRKSRSSACAARSPSSCRTRGGASRISPMSKSSTSPRSRNCASASQRTRAARRPSHPAAVSDARDRQCGRQNSAGQRAFRRRGRCACAATAPCISASRRRPRRASPCRWCAMPRRSILDMRRRDRPARRGGARRQGAREELTGSTITLSSLGALGGIASTPIINSPEVAIVGVNRIVERPVVRAARSSCAR